MATPTGQGVDPGAWKPSSRDIKTVPTEAENSQAKRRVERMAPESLYPDVATEANEPDGEGIKYKVLCSLRECSRRSDTGFVPKAILVFA